MSENNKNVDNLTSQKEFYDNVYMPKMNRIGKITGYVGVLLSFCPALALALAYGLLPDWAALGRAFALAAVSFGVLWFIEPISYFPILGPVGTYMAFLSGNISNMRVPCASMAQVSAEVEPGTPQGSVIATIGMATSIIINIAILTLGVVLGTSVLSRLPAGFVATLNYLLPALFGALFMQFAMKDLKTGIVIIIFAILINLMIKWGWFNWLPGASMYLSILLCVAFAVVFAIVTSKKKAASKE